MKKFKLSTKMVFILLMAGVIPASVISLFTLQKTERTLRTDAYSRLTSMREMNRIAITELFTTMEKQIITMAEDPFVVEAMKSFKKSFHTYSQDLQRVKKVSSDDVKGSLQDYYLNQFNKRYTELNKKGKSGVSDLFANLPNYTKLLQYAYITQNTNPLGSKHQLEYANDSTNYSKDHKKFHPAFRKFLESFSYYDIFLVDPETGDVLYTVFKELDYATNLISGPYAKSGLGKAFETAKDMSKDAVAITDIEPYLPSYEAGASFISTPIYDGDEKIGVLIFQIPIDKIDRILTADKKWKDSGMGRTGETYLVGPDYKMRTISRLIVENPKEYAQVMKSGGMDEELIELSMTKGTSALFQEIKTEGVIAALKGKTGTMSYPNFRGQTFIAAYEPFEFKGLKWAMISEMEEEEVMHSLIAVRRVIGVVLGISLVIIGVVAFYFTRLITKPIIIASEALALRSEDLSKLSHGMASAANQLSASSTEQASATQESVSAMEEMSSMIGQTSEFARSSQELAKEVRGKTEEGDRIMKQLVSSMELIHQANTQLQNMINIINDISAKTNVINDIVFKTQLLSFNASIEAARAGQHGKGFAVVAEEVGNLARLSGKAAEEIKTLIQDSQNQVKQIVDSTQSTVAEGQDVTSKALKIFQEISVKVNSINDQIRRINEAATEQGEGVKQTTQAIKQMDEAAKNNESVAHETLNYSKDLTGLNKGVFDVMKVLKIMFFGTSDSSGKKEMVGKTSLASILEKKKGQKGAPTALSLVKGKTDNKDKDLVNELIKKKALAQYEDDNDDLDNEENFERVNSKRTGTDK